MSFLIPTRRERPSDDPIFAANAEARARAQAGESVVNATVGALLDDEGRLATLEGVVEALHEVPADKVAGYAPLAGFPDFLKGVVADLLGSRPETAEAAAVATPGGTGALRHAIANFLEPKQKLLTTSFYWGPYKTLADECDREVSTFPMFDEAGAFGAAAFDRALGATIAEQGRALVLLNSPCHNPTGYSLDAGEWRAIREVVERHAARGPITICLDIAYARFGKQPLDVMLDEMLKLKDKALLTFAWSASKTFLEYGLRVGALVALHPDAEERTRIQNALNFSCRGTWSNVNAGGMLGLTNVLVDAARKARVDTERSKWTEVLGRRVTRFNELAKPAGLRYPRYDGGFFTTVFTEDAATVTEQLKLDGVFVVAQPGAIRVALCGVAERDIPRLVEAIVRRVR